jgi:hypothetical protein
MGWREGSYHFRVAGSVEQDPVHELLYSYLPRSTHAVGAGSAGHPLSTSQHNIPPGSSGCRGRGSCIVLFDEFPVAEVASGRRGVENTQVLETEHPHGCSRTN